MSMADPRCRQRLPRMAGPRHCLPAVRIVLGYWDDRRRWRLAVVTVLVAALAMRTEGARISLPGHVDAVGVLTWPVRFALRGLAPLAKDHGIELEDLRVRLGPVEAGRFPHPCTESFPIYQAAEEGVIQTLQGDVHGGGGPWPCKLRVEAHVEGYPLALPLSSPPFLLHMPSPDAGDREGRHRKGA